MTQDQAWEKSCGISQNSTSADFTFYYCKNLVRQFQNGIHLSLKLGATFPIILIDVKWCGTLELSKEFCIWGFDFIFHQSPRIGFRNQFHSCLLKMQFFVCTFFNVLWGFTCNNKDTESKTLCSFYLEET